MGRVSSWVGDALVKVGRRIGPHPVVPAVPILDPRSSLAPPAPVVGVPPAADPYVGQDPWLSGGKPLPAKHPTGTPPRRFQYQPGYNVQISPRSTESTTFEQLRLMSEYTIVRLIIEHVKEQIKTHVWNITAKSPDDKSDYSSDVSALKDFFESPDKQHAWDEWVGLVIEEVLVTDALSIYRHRTYGGDLHSLEIVDGATIKVLTDTRGFTPNPPWPAYQQFLYGTPYAWFTKGELLYRPRNRRPDKFYGFSPVEQIIITINEGIRRDLYNLAQFTDGNTPAGVGSMPEGWKPEDIREFQEYWDQVLSGQAQARSNIRFVPHGFNFQKFRDDETFGLFNKFDEWLARIGCFAFGISPMPFVTTPNRAVAQEMGDVESEGGVASMKMYVKRLLDRVIQRDMNYPHLAWQWTTDRARLQQKRVMRNKEYLATGVFQIDEVRKEEGLKPLGLPLGVMTQQGYMPFFPPEGQAPGAPGAPGAPPPAGPPRFPGGAPARPVMPDGSRPVIPPAPAAGQVEHRPASQGPGQFAVRGEATPGLDHEPYGWNQDIIGPEMGKALVKARLDELDQWERFAGHRLERGKHGASFKCEYLPSSDQSEIHEGLAKARSIDQLRHLFDTRRARVRATRLEPPHTQESVGTKTDLAQVLRAVLEREADRTVDRRGEKVAAVAAESSAMDKFSASMTNMTRRMEQIAKAPPANFSIYLPQMTKEGDVIHLSPTINVPESKEKVIKLEPARGEAEAIGKQVGAAIKDVAAAVADRPVTVLNRPQIAVPPAQVKVVKQETTPAKPRKKRKFRIKRDGEDSTIEEQ